MTKRDLCTSRFWLCVASHLNAPKLKGFSSAQPESREFGCARAAVTDTVAHGDPAHIGGAVYSDGT